MSGRRRTLALWAAVACTGPVPARASAPDDCRARLSFIEDRVDNGAKRSRQWALGWGLGLGALTIGQLALTPFVPSDERVDFYVGAVGAGVGALTRAVFIPRVIGHHRRMRRTRASGAPCARLELLEVEFAKDAQWERRGRHLLMHGLNLAFNAAIGVVLGVAFDRPVPGNRLAAIGAVVGEVMIITQPTYMMRSVQDYGRFDETTQSIRAAPMVLHSGGGLSIAGRM